MFYDFSNYTGKLSLDCDICIAGGGAAGITVAQHFIGTNKKVIILESGGIDYEDDVQELAAGYNKGQPYFNLDGCRLRMFGGSTNHWEGECAPLDEIDFEYRKWVPNSGWPITHEMMQKWYRKAQVLMQLGSFDFDFQERANDGYSYLDFDSALIAHKIWRHSEPPLRFGEFFSNPLRVAPNIHVFMHANLVNITTSPTGQVVRDFQVSSLEGNIANVRARHFILAMGGLENPRLLLNSTDYNQAGLGNENDLVGRFFMDHLNTIGGEIIALDDAWPALYKQFSFEDSPMSVLVRNAPELQRMDRVLNSAASFTQATFQRQKSAGYSSLHRMKEDLKNHQFPHRLGHHLWNVLGDIPGIIAAFSERMTPSLWVSLEAEQSPNPESRVFLSNELDRLGLHKIILDWKLTELDILSVHSLVKTVGRELGRLGVGRLRVASSLLNESLEWSGDDVQGGYHHMGTTRMSENPKQGVVDADCKLFGIENLYIAGSSVFPSGGCANPTFTIVALALRLAAHLEKRL